MTKYSLSVAVLSIAAIMAGSIAVGAPVFAERNESKLTISREGGDRENENEKESRVIKPLKWTVSCAVVTSTAMAPAAVQTYSDVLSILNADNQIVQAILLTNTTTAPTGGLSVAEAALLNVLRGKRLTYSKNITVRANEISAQIKTMIGMVQPLSNSTISPQLKKLVVNMLKDLNNQISNLGKLTCKRVPVMAQINPPVVPVTTTISTTTVQTGYTLAQVQAANSAQNCWTIVNGSVYNVTSWINQHPGGKQAITGMCGKDASSAFTNQHGGQGYPVSVLNGFKIGILQQ